MHFCSHLEEARLESSESHANLQIQLLFAYFLLVLWMDQEATSALALCRGQKLTPCRYLRGILRLNREGNLKVNKDRKILQLRMQSSTWRASTARDSFLFGSPSLPCHTAMLKTTLGIDSNQTVAQLHESKQSHRPVCRCHAWQMSSFNGELSEQHWHDWNNYHRSNNVQFADCWESSAMDSFSWGGMHPFQGVGHHLKADILSCKSYDTWAVCLHTGL